MDHTQWKETRTYVLYCLAATILLSAVFLLYFASAKRGIEAQAEEQLAEVTRQYTAVIQTELEGELNTVRALASVFGRLGLTDREQVLPLLLERVRLKKLKRMGLVTAEGMAFTTDDLVFQVRDREYYRRALQGEASLQVLLVDRTDNDIINVYTAPIRVNGRTEAALFATRRMSEFIGAIDDRLFKGAGQVVVTDGTGRILFRGHGPIRLEHFSNIMELAPPDAPPRPGGRAPDLLGNGGKFVYGGKSFFMAHGKLSGVADWHVFSLVSASTLLRDVGRMESEVVCLLLFLIVVSLLCLWLVARMQHRATRRLEKLNRSLETVIENIPGGFFRYDRDEGQAFDYVSEGFLRLLGHTRESFAAACGNRFDRMVHPDDRERVLASVREQTTRGDDATVEYRVFTADGRVLWLYDRGHLVREPSGRSRLYVIVMDITPLRQTRQALKISEERYRILTELSERIIFEHDLRGREGFLSPRFRDKFGYEPERDPATGALSETCVYEEDRGIYRNLVSRLLSGSSSSEEVRFLCQPSGYLWCRVQALTIRDEAGRPVRVVGEITDIDREKRNTERLRIRAQRDPLTGLYNASAVRALIQSGLESLSVRDRHALLVLDVNRFKEINDTCGHLAGDRALLEVAQRLLSALRDKEIAGRIGGDEFVALLRDVPTPADLARRVEHIRSVLSFPIGCGLAVSVSLGSAVFPDDGETYLDLFRRADAAMYADKKRSRARKA